MADNTSEVKHITALDFDMDRAMQQLDELFAKFNSISNEIANRNWSVNDIINGSGGFDKLKNEAASVTNEINHLQQQINIYNTNIINNITQVNQQVNNTTNEIREAGNAAGQMGEDMERAGRNTDNLNNRMNALSATITYQLVSALEDAARAAYEAVKSTEDSMTDISRVLNLTSTQAENMRSQMFGLGQEFGRSFDDVSAVTLRFAQAGYDMQESIELSKSALLALNTAELDVENGTQSLIGIISQWGMEASDLITIIDKLNYTADNNAVTTQDLVDGLLKASSMAKTAGMSFDDTVGVLTAMKVASGAAGKEVGNAFKSIMAYIQRPESLKLFDSMGIEVYADKLSGELLPMMTILENMTKKWNTSQTEMLDTMIKSGDAAQMMSEEWAIATDSMDEYTQYQNAMAEATDKANTAEARAQAQAAAGVFRRNYYISLMENFTKATEVSADLINAEGHSMAENSRYMETLTAKTEQLITALTELAVTAADAGLLDVAKSAIEAATQFTKWTTSTETLIPMLTSLAGIMVMINQNRIADRITATVAAFRNMGNAATGAAAGVGTLNTALGAVGLAATGISLIVTAIKAYNAQISENNQKLMEQGKAASESANNLNGLYDRYMALSEISSRTETQDNEYKTIQQDIVKLLGDRAAALEGLTQGTEEYNEALKGLIQTENYSYLEQLDKAKAAAEDEAQRVNKIKNISSTSVNNYNDPAGQYLYSAGLASLDSGIYSIDRTSDNFENYTRHKEALAALDAEYERLIKTQQTEAASALVNSEMYKNISSYFGEISGAVEKAVEAEVKYQEQLYIINNGLPKTYAEQVKMNDVIFIKTGLTEDYRAQVNELTTAYYSAADAEQDFAKMAKSEEWAATTRELETLAASGKLTADTILYTTAAHNGYTEQLKQFGMTAADCVNYFNKLAGTSQNAAGGVNDIAEAALLSEKELAALEKEITNFEKGISSINGYIQTLNEGNGLTAEQVLELCDTYGLLSEQFTLTEKGYQIEVSALEQLREAQAQEAIAARNSQIEQTKVLQSGIIERLKAYGIEINSIANLAEAQEALASVSAMAKDNQYGVNNAQDALKQQALHSVAAEIRDIANAYEETEKLADGFYKTLGVSFDTKKKETDVLKEITAAFEHLVDIGVYSIDEQIAYYEDLRRTLALTEEQYKSLESTLSKLYQEQLKQQQEAIKEQYENQKQAIEDRYDDEKEALKKALDDEKDARKEYWSDELDNLKTSLNEQISTAKKVYEQKKKLTEKSHDNQQKSLEALRDSELANIKATYNAQIDALNKIKAARQAERDEEDYQNERAELLEQISYYEQRTGTDAVEQLESLRKQLAELDRDRQRELEDEGIDNQISSLEEERDSKTEAVKNSYNQQIEALKTAQEIEVDMYKETYDREVELLKKRLETETKEMEKRRDRDLKRLEEEQSAKLKALEDEKDAAIKAADTKWKEIQKVFNDSNLALIAAAGQFAPALYEQFHNLFTSRFELDLQELASLMEQLETKKSTFAAKSGVKPTTKAPDTSLQLTIPSPLDKKNMAAAATGGKTLSDGIAMLHKDELVVNAPVTKWLEEMAAKFKVNVGVSPDITGNLRQMSNYYNSPRTSYNNTSNRYSNDRQVIQNFNVNAPLQNIEKIEDNADMEAAVNALERDIMRKVSTML